MSDLQKENERICGVLKRVWRRMEASEERNKELQEENEMLRERIAFFEGEQQRTEGSRKPENAPGEEKKEYDTEVVIPQQWSAEFSGACSLWEAVNNGDLLITRHLLSKAQGHGHPELEVQRDGYTPLKLAASKGSEEIVEELLKSGASTGIDEQTGYAVIHIAAEHNNISVLRLLLARGVDINLPGRNGLTPLHAAAAGGALDVVRFLLEAGANLAVVDEFGDSAIHLACRAGHYDVVNVLLESGSDPNSRGKAGETPLHCAAFLGDPVVTRRLLEGGAEAGLRTQFGLTACDIARRMKRDAVLSVLQGVARHSYSAY